MKTSGTGLQSWASLRDPCYKSSLHSSTHYSMGHAAVHTKFIHHGQQEYTEDIVSLWPVVLGVALILLCWAVLYLRLNSNRLSPLPGPPALEPFQLVGTIFPMPTSHLFKHSHAWTKRFGLMFRLVAGKNTIIILSDRLITSNLLNKRSANNSDRPHRSSGGGEAKQGINRLHTMPGSITTRRCQWTPLHHADTRDVRDSGVEEPRQDAHCASGA
jgi:hypothetical protein